VPPNTTRPREELIDLLDPRPGETFVDCTFGGGGHARLIAERLRPGAS
jgi:16S rRNA (cytosine1402-N4)-methyltransferase